MSKFRDLAIEKLDQSNQRTYRDVARDDVAKAHVYALLDLADAIRTMETPND